VHRRYQFAILITLSMTYNLRPRSTVFIAIAYCSTSRRTCDLMSSIDESDVNAVTTHDVVVVVTHDDELIRRNRKGSWHRVSSGRAALGYEEINVQ